MVHLFRALSMTFCTAPLARHQLSLKRLGGSRYVINFGLRLHLSSLAHAAHKATEQMKTEAEREMDKVVGLFSHESSGPTLWTNAQEVNDFVDKNIDSILFDCDGVLYRSPDEAPGASACIQSLLARGKKVFFVTNNAASNRKQLRDKLEGILRVDGLTEEMMVSSSYSAAQYLKKEILEKTGKGKLYVIGSDGLCEELRQTGFNVVGGPAKDEAASMSRDDLAAYDFAREHPIDAVVMGHDTSFNFRKLSIGTVLLQRNPDSLLVATNKDAFDLVGVDGRHIPGNGSLVASLEYSSGRKAVNVGKPSRTLGELIFEEHGLDPSRSLFVGDRLDTDIRFGTETGMYSVLVLTGVTTATELQDILDGRLDEPLPKFIMPHVGLISAA